jgi:hypothetical protein
MEFQMRINLLVLSTVFVLAACADDQHTTAPTRFRSTSSPSASGDMATRQGLGIPQAKPQDHVGFTQVTTVKSVAVNFGAGGSGSASATCPAGSQVIGGAYALSSGDFAIDSNAPNANNGWTVHGTVGAAGPLAVTVTAICIQ